ncbi:MAG: NEW3 domain-containing protein, partial [Candidatus Latescibacteria bacterium]|nr:NEW3 domain-containing protein [Candidatus Latescibacterota bacterium]
SGQGQRLSQVNFTQGVTSKQLSLTAFLPDRADDQVAIDKTIEFYALVLPQPVWRELQPLDGRMFTPEEVEKLNAGKVKLELIPRGVGRIEVRALTLYYEIKTDESVEMAITVHNDGTRRLDNIRIRTNVPPNWRATVEPDVIPLMPGETHTVKLLFLPPDGVGVGDYEVQIQTQALADNRPVETQDKMVRIHVSARTNLLLSAFLVLSVIGMVIGIVWYGVKLTRR